MQNTVKKVYEYLVHAFMSHLCLTHTVIAVFYLSQKTHSGDVWESLCMFLGYDIPLIICTFNSDVHFRSYAVARIGVFVLPTLTSFTQLDQGIWIHIIVHPQWS